jgi:uncharacterized protein (UPF0297 family)
MPQPRPSVGREECRLVTYILEAKDHDSVNEESHQLKELALLVRQGRFFEVQDWLAAGKPFRPISYRSARPLRDCARTGFYSMIELFIRQDLTQTELNEVLEEVVHLGREDLVKLLFKSGAQANNRLESFTSALWSGNPGIVRLFIEHGADLKSGAPLAWAFGKHPHRSLLGIFKTLISKDPSFVVQATQALNERIRARDEKWISLLLWVGADPRLPVDDVEIGNLKQSPMEQAVHSGNLAFLQKVKVDPAKDDVLLLLDNAGWFPNPEVVEYLLTFEPDLSKKLEDGRTLVERYVYHSYYSSDCWSWRLDQDKLINCIEMLARRGAVWCPSDKSDYRKFRAVLRKMDHYRAMTVLENFIKIGLFGPGTFRVLMSTPAMKDLLGTDFLRAAAGCKLPEKRRRRVNKSR